MPRIQPLRFLASLKTTIFLLLVLAVLLFLNVALPQESTLGKEAFDALIRQAGPVYRFVLGDLGLGHMATSPVFLAALGLFFLNLGVVIAGRIGPTIRRVRLKPRAESGLRAWTGMEESLSGELPAVWSADHAVETLKGFGYQVRKVGEKTVWAVRHRTAPLGFLAFHFSFFLICAGGALLYYSRFVGDVILVEGQQFQGEYQQVVREPPLFPPPDLRFALQKVVPLYEDGFPLQLGAVFRFMTGGGAIDRESWINRPAAVGSAKLLVHRAGLAPVFWLQDGDGFTLDRVSVVAATLGKAPTLAPIGDGAISIEIEPLEPDARFPELADLPDTGVSLRIVSEGMELFRGVLRPGEAASWSGGRLVLEELRYWVAFQVIAERGGGLLIAGFVLGITGLIWRLLWYRREVALSWDASEFRLTGRGEYFSQRFHEELGSIRDYLAAGPEKGEEVS
ncbi:MAG: cytochrome c biogenesis protein ResB [Acidobacteria bacterium]|uniref:Cytochrome c biogenesis protein ResB n=1 Tax=Candidatus Polarisedimenticola svalbardensis TaxID=2886004 RepID=A0A8J6Y2J5_9BACT|nr:cytochrome c biogenesis protein ResB [Candidatus Polarisedimenticola svalbardensis]